jgi:hypothetical protein
MSSCPPSPEWQTGLWWVVHLRWKQNKTFK